MIELDNFEVIRGDTKILAGVSLKVQKGEVIRLIGPNGCGKTSLLQDLVEKFSDSIAYLPQVSNKFPKIHLELKDICNTEFSFYPRSLFDKAWHYASGGERKKSLIGRVLSQKSDFIFLDEPFNDLDLESILQIKEILVDLSNSGVGVVYIDHDVEVPGTKKIEVQQWKC